jgi:hypothetical protein
MGFDPKVNKAKSAVLTEEGLELSVLFERLFVRGE